VMLAENASLRCPAESVPKSKGTPVSNMMP
jgi:hypothetical protein